MALFSSRYFIAVALVLGLGVGAVAAHMLAPQPSPKITSTFTVDPSNTPGFPDIKGGDFDLIDHNGARRTSKNPNGQHQLLFFGYVNCNAICTQALPHLAEAVELLDEMNVSVTPVLITVDPKRDTIAELKKSVGDIHPRLMGLTGSEAELDAAYKAFQLEKKFLFHHVDEGDVFAHGSFIYLLGPDGAFKTLFAPVTNPVRIAEISAGYIAETR